MRKSKKEGRSILRSMIKNYIVLTVTILVFMGILVNIYSYQYSKINVKPNVDAIVEQKENLQKGNYDVLKDESVLGRLGFYEVFDDKGELLFCSRPEHRVKFTLSELELINLVDERVEVDVKRCENWAYDVYYVITRSYYSEENEVKKSTYTIVDETYNVVDGYYADEYSQLTPGQFAVISQNVIEDYVVNRYVYEANEKQYSVVCFSYVAPEKELKQLRERLYRGLVIFFIFYIVLLLIMIGWTHRTMKRPLKMLDEAFNQYEAGKIMELDYEGPREFEKIFESFGEMAQRLARSEESRKRLEVEQNKMIANIAHDIRTPVTVISGYAKAILDGMMPEQEQRRYVESIYQKSHRLSGMVETFAEYSKLEHPEFRLEKRVQNFSEMLRVYLANKYSEIEVEGFGFDAEIPEEVILCDIDTFQFSRVMENIITNSFRYNEAGTMIYVKLEKIDGMAQLHVGDNGKGISEEYRERIFKPFVVVDDSRGTGQGSGLGLSITKKIVEEHGGTIELMKNPQYGWNTEFVIRIPIVNK